MIRILFVLLISSQTTLANIGFYAKHSSVIPTSVQRRLDSIFRVEATNFLTLSLEQAEAFLTADNLEAEGLRTIKKCRAMNEPTCTFPIIKLQGTAFVDRQKNLFWTNCHLIDGWIRFEKQKLRWSRSSQKLYSSLKKTKLPIQLFNSNNQRVDTDGDEFSLKIASVIDSETVESSGCDLKNDAIQFQSSKSFGPAIPWANSESAENEETFMGGYPLPVTRSGLPSKSKVTSAHENFHWTIGKSQTVIQVNDIIFKNGTNPDLYSLVLTGPYGKYVTNDSAEGMSGSPILNSRGEVIGIFRGIIPRNSSQEAQNEFPLISLGINTQGLMFLKFLTEER